MTETRDLLAASVSGDAEASEQLFVQLYDHLRRLASSYLDDERSHTLQATGLVHEAYLKLIGSASSSWQSRAHFMAVSALAMRQILKNYARDKNAMKRGRGWQRVTMGLAEAEQELDLLVLEDALTRLSDLNERHARVVTARLIAGLTVEETASALNLSERTVKGDWSIARAWLARELGPSSGTHRWR